MKALRQVRSEWRDSQKRARDPGGRELPSREGLTVGHEGLEGARCGGAAGNVRRAER